MREVAYRRLLARLFAARPDGWVVKGGVALLLRLDPNRTSNDIDITYIDEAGEHAWRSRPCARTRRSTWGLLRLRGRSARAGRR